MNITRTRLESVMTFISRSLLLVGAVATLCALSVSPVLAKDLFYTTVGAGSGTTSLFAIQVSGSKIPTPTEIGQITQKPGQPPAGDCTTLALSSSGGLYSICGALFGTQYLATIDPKTAQASVFGEPDGGQGGTTPSGHLAIMAMGFASDGTLYVVGDCNPDPTTFECTPDSDPTFNTLFKVDVTTGAFTPIGPTGAPQLSMDLQFDPRDGQMLGVTTTVNLSNIPAILYRIDLANGKATPIVNLVGSNSIMGLAFGRDGKLYGSDSVPNPGFYLIDPQTGLEQEIAALPLLAGTSGLELANPVGSDPNTD